MCVQLHSTTLKQLAIKARAKDGRTTLTHTGGTCITTQPSSPPQEMPAPTCIPCASSPGWSAQPQRHQSQGSSSHSMSSPSPAPAPAAWGVQGWNTCCSSAVEWSLEKFSLSCTHSQKTSTAELKTSKFTPEVRTPQNCCLLTKSSPHFSGAIQWNTRDEI